jgi:hypothetical protein
MASVCQRRKGLPCLPQITELTRKSRRQPYLAAFPPAAKLRNFAQP